MKRILIVLLSITALFGFSANALANTIIVEANGDVTFSITYSKQMFNAQVFARQNGLQNVATSTPETNNGNGTYTYSHTQAGGMYSSGDLIEARFYGFDGSAQIFSPGPTDSSWVSITYGSNPDTTPPTVPNGLNTIATMPNNIQMAWNASSDAESGVSHYTIYVNGIAQGTTTSTSHTIAGLQADTSYNITVSATDGANIESGQSTLYVESTLPLPNNIPVAQNDSLSTLKNQIVLGDVSSNDTGLQDTPVSYFIQTSPSNGSASLNTDGTFSYSPNTDFVGTDQFSYVVSDNDNETDSALVTIVVNDSTPIGPWAALHDASTPLEQDILVNSPTALTTYLGDRARDRHARENEFQAYDHYLKFYWEDRTAAIEIIDPIGKGGNTITFNVTTQFKLSDNEAELRFFYEGLGTVAQYCNNGVMTRIDATHYTRSVSTNCKFGHRPLQVGDRMEFELSQFLDASVPNGRANYYGTTFLYIVGQGIVPWEAHGVFGDHSTEREDSYPIPEKGWLGGLTTLPYQYSDEPDDHFMQMAGNLSSINGQTFVLGRRVFHTDFETGEHDEDPQNPTFPELANKIGPNYINNSCVACHAKNGRALPPGTGVELEKFVVKVGNASGLADPSLGSVLQPQHTGNSPEGSVSISSWSENNGLRSPNYTFTGTTPSNFSARISPQLVGLGLLEAIPETAIEALANPGGSGISGRVHVVTDSQGVSRVGRFGWKAGKGSLVDQVAGALNTDMGVMTSRLPTPDCGSSQTGCGSNGSEISDTNLENLTAYVALLGVSARRDLDNSDALAGETLFNSAGCAACHTPTFTTSAFHPHAELRNQTIHPYTDLLLHDMGPGLADNLPEGDASGTEWRTAPLWNIGLTSGVSGGEAYLHDGRARNLTEAILWHGGEGESAKQAFEALSASDQAKIIHFLKSL